MTFKAEEQKKRANFYKIKEGSFRLTSHKDDPAAQPRDYTNPKTGEKGTAYERVFPALNGLISNIYFSEHILADGTKLKSLNIKLGEDEGGTEQIVTLPEDSRFTGDFLTKLPNIDTDKPVRLAPFDFEPEQGARKVGISITQGEEANKITNFFVKLVLDGTNRNFVNLHGYPEATDEDRSDWKFYYQKVNKFLIKYAKENVLPKFGDGAPANESNSISYNSAQKDFDADDLKDSIPF